jgi:hypothetical protein
MSHDWQPQVITHFGENSMKNLLREDETMDTLRTGGHIRQNNMYPQDRYAMGGELKTTWGGYAEPISQNPYLPGTGETVMFRGKSHEEGDGNGHTGIGVKYGSGDHDSYTDYAEYGTEQADADVEVERGEPAVKLEDEETGEENLIVYGNLQIPNYGVAELQDPKAKGKKFKNYVNDLSKIEARQSKIMDRATTLLEDLDPQNSFDQLSIASANAMMQGANMKLKEIASKKKIAAGIQGAINDTAEEHGLVADDLARGKVKEDKEARKQMAKYGKELFKAQDGTWIDQILDYESQQGSALGGGLSNFGIKKDKWENKYPEYWKDGKVDKEEARDFIKREFLPQVKDYPEAIQKRLVDYMYNTGRSANDLLLNATGNLDLETMQTKSSDEDLWKKNKQKIIELSQDPNFGNKLDAAKSNVMKDFWTRKGTPEVYDNTSKDRIFMWDKSQQTPQQNNTQSSDPQPEASTTTASNSKLSKLEALNYIPKGQSKGKVYYGDVTDKDVEQLKANNSWYDWKNFNPARKEDVRKFQKAFNAEAKKVGSNARIKEDDQLGKQTASAKGLYDGDAPTGNSDLKLNVDWGKGRQYTVQDFERKAPKGAEEFVGETPKKKGFDYANLFNMISPYIKKPSNAEAFDYSSLTPEYFAMASNQLDPVNMQMYRPELEQPFDISLQDQLNANQADFNAIQRQQGYNPEAAAALAAQKYAANSGVLGKQFQLNQAEKAGVYNRNRQVLNDAQLKNLGIMDTQAGRQALAKSKTKQQAFDALSSIADKMAKHKLENRTLGVYENMYNYRFGKDDMRAYNVNDPYNFNTEGRVWSGTVPEYDAQGNIVGYRPAPKTGEKKDEKGKKTSTTSNTTTAFPTFNEYSSTIDKTKKPSSKPTMGSLSNSIFDKKKSRNGSIVKAIKNL